jgi:hypothetical protein
MLEITTFNVVCFVYKIFNILKLKQSLKIISNKLNIL